VRVDVHTHVVPERWEDWAVRHGGGNWPRLEPRDACRATIFTGAQFFRDIDDRSWDPARRLEDMDRLGRRRAGTLADAGDVLLLGGRQGHPGLRADAERARGRDRREASPALRRHGYGAAPGARAGDRRAAPRARGAG